ncbi:hypothetical protein [Streptomyces tubercidicus]
MTGADAFGTGDGGVPGSEARNVISAGVFLDTVVQAGRVTLQQPRPGIPALCGLPAPSPTFTGREAALAELDEVLRPQGVATRCVPVAVVAGLGGVGKTELLTHLIGVAYRATTHLRSERAPATRFETLKQALKWLDTEYPNLLALAPVAPTLPHA